MIASLEVIYQGRHPSFLFYLTIQTSCSSYPSIEANTKCECGFSTLGDATEAPDVISIPVLMEMVDDFSIHNHARHHRLSR